MPDGTAIVTAETSGLMVATSSPEVCYPLNQPLSGPCVEGGAVRAAVGCKGVLRSEMYKNGSLVSTVVMRLQDISGYVPIHTDLSYQCNPQLVNDEYPIWKQITTVSGKIAGTLTVFAGSMQQALSSTGYYLTGNGHFEMVSEGKAAAFFCT